MIAILCVLIFSITSCGKKEDDPAVVSTLTMTCVYRTSPEDTTGVIGSCHELTYSSDNQGAANGRCQTQANIFPGKTCAQLVDEGLVTPYEPFKGSCAWTDMVDGLSTPGTDHISYAYAGDVLGANEGICLAAGGVWTAPSP